MRFVSALSLVLVVGMGGNAVAQGIDIGAPPGKIIDLGRQRLHVHCTGTGAPTVVLEAGASAFAIDFALVQPEISKTNRVCSYDRAGSGWSAPNPDIDDPNAVPSILRAALSAAGEKPPYLLMGASMGGVYVRLYHAQFPDEVAGMVLVDGSDGSGLFLMIQGKVVSMNEITEEQMRATAQPRPASITPRVVQTGAPFDRLPPDLYRIRVELERRLIAAASGPIELATIVTYNENMRTGFAKLRALAAANPKPLGDRPLVVLTRGAGSGQGLRDMHAAIARLSTNSRHTVVPNAGHEIHLFEPPAVIQAIQDVAGAINSKTKLPVR